MDWHKEYDRIIAEMKKCREAEDYKGVKRWMKKLEKWQLGYGAYAPVR